MSSDGREGFAGRKWIRVLGRVIATWAFLAGIVVLGFVPDTPRTARGWALLLTVGPAVYLGMNWVGERVRPRFAAEPARFSVAWFAWMLLAVLVGCVVVALSFWLSLLFDH